MALDPSISLNVKPVEGVDISKWGALRNLATQNALMEQQISASQTGQELTRAQIPGVAAQSVTAQQKAIKDKQDQDAATLAMDLAASGKYTSEKDGVKIIDYPKLYGDLSTKFPQQALGMAKVKGDTDYQSALATGQQAVSESERLKVKSALKQFGDTQIQVMANVIEKGGGTPEEKGVRLQEGIKRLANTYPEAFADSPYLIRDPKTGTTTLTQTLTGSSVKQIADGSMTPLIAAQLAISQNQLALEQLKASPSYQATVSTIPTAGDRVSAAQTAAGLEAYQTDLNAGINAKVDSIKFGKPGSIAQDAWQKLVLQDPAYATKERAIQAYNAKNGTNYSVSANGLESINRLLANESGKVGAVAKVSRGIATSPVIPGANAMPQTPNAPAATQPTPGPAAPPAANPPAQTISSSHVADYAKRTGKTVDQVTKELAAKGIKVQ